MAPPTDHTTLSDKIVDPITLEPICELEVPPFELGRHLFDAEALAACAPERVLPSFRGRRARADNRENRSERASPRRARVASWIVRGSRGDAAATRAGSFLGRRTRHELDRP